MPLVVPNPTVPTNGQALDATPLLANLNAVYQAIQSFDASQVQAGTLVASAFNANINPNTILRETMPTYVQSGCTWSAVSGLSGSMTGGIAYIASSVGSFRVNINSVGSNTFAASKDVYVDIDINGNITYSAVANGAAAPALTANSVRVAIIVTGASAITSITQMGFDSLGNMIYRTKRFAIGVFADGGTATNFLDFGLNVKFATGSVVFARTVNSAVCPSDFDTTFQQMNMRYRMYSNGSSQSLTFSVYIGCQVVGSTAAAQWNIATNLTTASVSFTNGVITDVVVPINSASLVPGGLLASAITPNNHNTGELDVYGIICEYRPISPPRL